MWTRYSKSYGQKVTYRPRTEGEQKLLKWDDLLNAADLEMSHPPPAGLEYHPSFKPEQGWKVSQSRNVHAQKNLLLDMCMLNGPEFIPPIIYSFKQRYDNGRHLTRGQLAVVQTVYTQLCWEGVILDPNWERWKSK